MNAAGERSAERTRESLLTRVVQAREAIADGDVDQADAILARAEQDLAAAIEAEQ